MMKLKGTWPQWFNQRRSGLIWHPQKDARFLCQIAPKNPLLQQREYEVRSILGQGLGSLTGGNGSG